MCVCPVIYLVVVVVVVAGMRRRRSNLVSCFVVVAPLSLLPTGTLCVSFLSLSLTHIARLQQLLESVKHTRQLLLLLSSYWYRNSHSLTHTYTVSLTRTRSDNFGASFAIGNATQTERSSSRTTRERIKITTEGQRHKQSTVGTLWEWNDNEQRNERSKDFA